MLVMLRKRRISDDLFSNASVMVPCLEPRTTLRCYEVFLLCLQRYIATRKFADAASIRTSRFTKRAGICVGQHFLNTCNLHQSRAALTDPRGGHRDAPFRPISFIFMQFSAKILSKIDFCHKFRGKRPPVMLVSPPGKSWIRHWAVLKDNTTIISTLYLQLNVANWRFSCYVNK